MNTNTTPLIHLTLAEIIETRGRFRAVLIALTAYLPPKRPKMRDILAIPRHLHRDVGVQANYEKPPDVRMTHF